jgi:transcriptional regulator with XRE-family HTH domain
LTISKPIFLIFVTNNYCFDFFAVSAYKWENRYFSYNSYNISLGGVMPKNTGERVKKIRTELRMSQAELAKKSGLSQPTISGLERGESQTSGSIARIADALGVSALWLETGMGSPEPISKTRAYKRIFKDGESDEEYEIPLLEAKGSCGNGRHNFADPYLSGDSKSFFLPQRFLKRFNAKPDALIGIYADGDSMANFITHGDLLVFDCSISELRTGDIYAIDTPDGMRVKRVHRRVDGSVVLASDNPDKTRYPDESYSAEQAEQLSIKGRFVLRIG